MDLASLCKKILKKICSQEEKLKFAERMEAEKQLFDQEETLRVSTIKAEREAQLAKQAEERQKRKEKRMLEQE